MNDVFKSYLYTLCDGVLFSATVSSQQKKNVEHHASASQPRRRADAEPPADTAPASQSGREDTPSDNPPSPNLERRSGAEAPQILPPPRSRSDAQKKTLPQIIPPPRTWSGTRARSRPQILPLSRSRGGAQAKTPPQIIPPPRTWSGARARRLPQTLPPPRSRSGTQKKTLPQIIPPPRTRGGGPGGGVKQWQTSPHLWSILKPRARKMRKNPTPAETALWQRLRKRQLCDTKFRRQHAIGRYIVDFYAREPRLIIEVDGPIHEQQREADAVRQQHLESRGYHVLRFTNERVLHEIDAVLDEIKTHLGTPSTSQRSHHECKP